MDLALFDFDGTITRREMFIAFLELAVEPRRLAFGKTVLAPLAIGYKLGLVPGNLVRAAAVRVGLSGASHTDLESYAIEFAQRVLPTAIRPEALERIGWHKARGDTIVVVSGALEIALSPWCMSHGLELIGSRLEQRDGHLTGRYLGPQCVRGEKARRIRERHDLSHYECIHAYGDTRDDRDMLALAHRRHYRWRELPMETGDGKPASKLLRDTT